MKTKFIRILYRFTAFLADKSNGFPLFSKWKIALGSLLIGTVITSVSCNKQKVTCYETSSLLPPSDSIEEVTCYEPAVPEKDTIIPPASQQQKKQKQKVTPLMKAVEPIEEPLVTCYDVIISPVDTLDDDTIYEYVEEMPKFPGGEKGIVEYLSENLPKIPVPESVAIIGRIAIRVVIDKEGNVTNPQVVRGSNNEEYNKKLVQLIEQMPQWTPAKQNGKPVSCYFTIPIHIHLNR